MPKSRKANFRSKRAQTKKRGKRMGGKRMGGKRMGRRLQKGGKPDFWDEYCDKYRDEMRDIYDYHHIVDHNGHIYKTDPGKKRASDKYIKMYKEKFKFFQKINEDMYDAEKEKTKDIKQDSLGPVSILKKEGERDVFPEEGPTSEIGKNTHDLKKNMEQLNNDENTCKVKPYCSDTSFPEIDPIPKPIGIITTTSLSKEDKVKLDDLLEAFVETFNTKLDESKLLADLLDLIHQKDDVDRRRNVSTNVDNPDCKQKYSEIFRIGDQDRIKLRRDRLEKKYNELDHEYNTFYKKIKDIRRGIEKSDYLKSRIHGTQDTLFHMNMRLRELNGELVLLPRNPPANIYSHLDSTRANVNHPKVEYDVLNRNSNKYNGPPAASSDGYEKIDDEKPQYYNTPVAAITSGVYMEAEPSEQKNPYMEIRGGPVNDYMDVSATPSRNDGYNADLNQNENPYDVDRSTYPPKGIYFTVGDGDGDGGGRKYKKKTRSKFRRGKKRLTRK